jgi:very-short-patch-repair endonuclease
MKEEEIRAICIDKAIKHLEQQLDDWEESGNPPMESPIERMLNSALVISRIERNLSDGEPQIWKDKSIGSKAKWDFECSEGLSVDPQRKVGKFRVDFTVSYHCHAWPNTKGQPGDNAILDGGKTIIIECDGHEWHERTEKERRYEKQRDRFLQSKGYEVFHYTGKEITDDPFKVADEILDYLMYANPMAE